MVRKNINSEEVFEIGTELGRKEVEINFYKNKVTIEQFMNAIKPPGTIVSIATMQKVKKYYERRVKMYLEKQAIDRR
jgi:D-arabinose 1-dehydrogenase-like Zn-dependent alcohol dehydrogenase